MKIKTAVSTACCVCMCVISPWSIVNAGAIKANILEKTKKEQADADFADYIDGILVIHPSLISAKVEIDVTKLKLVASRNPLYNPELVLEAENSDVTSYQVGIVQTIDWQNKKAVNIKQATLAIEAAKVKYFSAYERVANDLLFAMVSYLSTRDVGILAKKRVSLMQQFVKIANRRKSAGDINQVDIDVARLALAESVMQHSESSSDLIDAQIKLMSLTGLSFEKPFPFPSYLPELTKSKLEISQLVEVHPDVVLSQMNIQMAKARTRIVDTNRRANPTFSLSAGKEDSDALVGFSFSIPLMIRNNFNSDVNASRELEIQAQQSAVSIHRRVSANALLAQKRYLIMTKAWHLWESNGRSVLKSHQTNLERLWKAGEIDVSQYLVQLKQSLDTQHRGSIMQRNVWMAWLNWLKTTGQINMWLKKMKSGDSKND